MNIVYKINGCLMVGVIDIGGVKKVEIKYVDRGIISALLFFFSDYLMFR